jgi:Protein involved in formate dehydrogenase formation
MAHSTVARAARPRLVDRSQVSRRFLCTIAPVAIHRSHPHLVRPPRNEPREIGELRQLRISQPDLAPAVDLQIALVGLQRRVQARVPMPWLEVDPHWLKQQHELGRPLLRFEDIPLDWTDLRLMVRQASDLLRRFDMLDLTEHAKIQALARTENLEPLVVRWFNEKAAPERVEAGDAKGQDGIGERVDPDALEQVLTLAMRPFLERCAEVLLQRAELSTWSHGHCPLCAGEPEMAVIMRSAERVLICGRCTARWPYDPLACPFCGNANRERITSFASRDGLYRIYACDVCQRYLKAYDARHAVRPVMLAVDSIATLPLDAAAMQKGYRG